MENASLKLTVVERKIMRAFNEIEDTICNLRDLISSHGQSASSLAIFPRIWECEKQLTKLLVTAYAAEVFFRHPEDQSNNNSSDLH